MFEHMERLSVPAAILKADDEAAARRRRELREKLLRGEEVKITPRGHVEDANKNKISPGIVVPEGKLASFYWYENDPELFEDEKAAMSRFFPQFKLEELEDGRLYWYGALETNLRQGGIWYLQAIYDNNHPNNSTYGGSVKVYSISPDLAEIQKEIDENIPHLLVDSKKNLYLCTARKEDIKVGNTVTSAASSLAWAAKWIAAFEMWMAGDLSTDEFIGHKI
jgi:hypothetical protein